MKNLKVVTDRNLLAEKFFKVVAWLGGVTILYFLFSLFLCHLFGFKTDFDTFFNVLFSIFSPSVNIIICLIWFAAMAFSVVAMIWAFITSEKKELNFYDDNIEFVEHINGHEIVNSYAYDDVESVNLEIATQFRLISTGRYSSRYVSVISKLDLIFNFKNSAEPVILHFGGNKKNLLNILKTCGDLNGFSYNISGSDENDEKRKLIEQILAHKKPFIYEEKEVEGKYALSIGLPLFATWLLVQGLCNIGTCCGQNIIIFLVPVIFLISSVIMLITLEIDRKRKFDN